MNIVHTGLNIAPELELVTAFVDLNSAQLASSIVDILKQVPVNGAEMTKIKCPDGCTFRDSVSHQAALDPIKPSRI